MSDDRVAIQDLLFRYCHLLDTGRAGDIPDLIFTEDAVLDYGSGQVVGREAVRELFSHHSDVGEATSANVTNVVISIDGDSARSLARVTAWHWDKASRHLGQVRAADYVQIAAYADEHRREAGRWRIARRTVYGFGGQIGAGVPPPEMLPGLEGLIGRVPSWPIDD